MRAGNKEKKKMSGLKRSAATENRLTSHLAIGSFSSEHKKHEIKKNHVRGVHKRCAPCDIIRYDNIDL
jgi:hypothetical protein